MSESAEPENLRPVDFKFLECKRIILSYAHALSLKIYETATKLNS
jgi:hypothetical protein